MSDIEINAVPPVPSTSDALNEAILDMDGVDIDDEDGKFDDPDEHDDALNPFRATLAW